MSNNTTSSSQVKHPELRPRIFDPFSNHGDIGQEMDSSPGAVEVFGPSSSAAARKGADDVLAMEQGANDQREQTKNQLERDDDGHHLTTLKQDQNASEKRRLFGMAGCLVVLFTLCIIVAIIVVLVLVVGGANKSSSPFPPPSNSLPTPANGTSGPEVPMDWVLVSEILGSVDSFGYEVDFNSDGTLLAVASPKAHNGRGQVEFYKRKIPLVAETTDDQPFEEWDRLGAEPIVGDSDGDFASQGMDLSVDGSYLAVGYPGNGNGFVRVFKLDDGGEWKQQGQTLAGPSLMSQFGASVSLGKNGRYILVGAPLAGEEEQGMVQAYKWMPEFSNWTEHGNDWYGNNPGDRFGSSVGIAADGSRVAIGAPGDDTKWEDGGRVYFFNFHSTSSADDCISVHGCWREDTTDEVTGQDPGNLFGSKLDIDPKGLAVVSSSIPYSRENSFGMSSTAEAKESNRDGIGMGIVRVFSMETLACFGVNEIGFGMFGSSEGEGLGYGLAFDANDGVQLAATSLNKETQTGVAQAYIFETGEFVQMGSDIEGLSLGSSLWQGTGPETYSGPSISLADPRMAVGYQSVLHGAGKEEVPGVVRVFRYQPLTEVP